MEPRMKRILYGIGCVTLIASLSACRPGMESLSISVPEENTASGTEVHDDAMPNEATPQTVDSLEVSTDTGVTLTVTRLSGSIVLGNLSAPRLVMWSDYGCVYCREFILEDLPWLTQRYLKPGTLAFERISFPRDAAGELMARIAECSVDAHLFMETDHALAAMPVSKESDIPSITKRTGLDAAKLRSCIASDAARAMLSAAKTRADEMGISRIPYFTIQRNAWLGVLNRDELQKMLDEAVR